MFQILITGLCLYSALIPIAMAQLHQNSLGFQPTNNLTVAKGNRVGLRTTTIKPTPPPGWPAPPPAPPGGWPAIPPSPPPPPTPNDCSYPGTPVGSCPNPDPAQSAYLASTKCECFFQCSNGVPISKSCSTGLYFNPTLKVCDYPASSGCTQGPTTVGTTAVPTRLFGRNTIAKKD